MSAVGITSLFILGLPEIVMSVLGMPVSKVTGSLLSGSVASVRLHVSKQVNEVSRAREETFHLKEKPHVSRERSLGWLKQHLLLLPCAHSRTKSVAKSPTQKDVWPFT